MARRAKALTTYALQAAKPQAKPYKLFDGGGLYLEVFPNADSHGGRYWRLKYRFAGAEKRIALGVYPSVSLAEARVAREGAKALLRDGKDPGFVRKEEKIEQRVRSESTFETVARDWLAHKVDDWTPDHWQGVLASMQTNLFPRLGAIPVAEMTETHIRECIKAIEHREALEVAGRSLQRCTRILQYAIQMGLRSGNPARELRGIVRTRAAVHRAAFPVSELPDFLRRLSEYKGRPENVLGLTLQLLTAVRPGELRYAAWAEFDTSSKEWRIPGPRMKMREEHVVPLSAQALEVLEELHPITGKSSLLFPGSTDRKKPISENTLLFMMYRLGYHNRATPHGLRAVFSTWANEQGFKSDVIERQLAHRERNKVRAAYNRAQYLTERRNLMQAWADFIDSHARGNKVVPGKFGRAA